ncbi:MAG: PSD1 and planctomycete cytochrome C domain-containing protein [Pirellulaceae bacterium]
MSVLAFFALLLASFCHTTSAQAEDKLDFAHDIAPLIKARCGECHTGGASKGDLSLNTRQSLLAAGVAQPGRSAASPLIERVTSDDVDLRMPPKGPPLSKEEVALLEKWIDAGLPWQEGFSFKHRTYKAPLALQTVALPPSRPGREHPLDRLLWRHYAEYELIPPQPIDDAAFLRRASLDLIGLLPTPEQVCAFQRDTSQDKRRRAIQRLLDDKQAYAEHWLTFWNDLLRNDYAGTGFIDGGRRQITTWLYAALLENKPYDQFVRELIAPTPDSAGFIHGIKWRGRVNASQVQEIQFAQNVGQVFLGINLKCASCHDSFIDDWKLVDSYGLAAVISDRPLEIHRCDQPTGEMAQAKFVYPQLGAIDPNESRDQRLAQCAQLLTSPKNGRFARTIVNRLWHRLMGRGVVHPVDVMANEPWSEDLLEYLAADLVAHDYDLQRTLQLIATSDAYQGRCVSLQDSLATDGAFLFHGPIARRMTAEQFLDAIWRITATAPAKPAAGFEKRGEAPVRASLVVSDALMRSLGRPNREQVVTTRPDDLTTLQALDLSNGPILAATLDRGATNLLREHPDWTADEAVDHLYFAALSREPTDEERRIAREIAGAPLSREGLADLLWAVFMLPEFQLVH